MSDRLIDVVPATGTAQWTRHPSDPPPEAKFLRGPQPRGFEFGRAVKIFREAAYGEAF